MGCETSRQRTAWEFIKLFCLIHPKYGMPRSLIVFKALFIICNKIHAYERNIFFFSSIIEQQTDVNASVRLANLPVMANPAYLFKTTSSLRNATKSNFLIWIPRGEPHLPKQQFNPFTMLSESILITTAKWSITRTFTKRKSVASVSMATKKKYWFEVSLTYFRFDPFTLRCCDGFFSRYFLWPLTECIILVRTRFERKLFWKRFLLFLL